MKLSIFIVVLASLLLVPATVWAAPVSNATPYIDAEIAYDMKLAHAYWGESSSCSRQVYLADIPEHWGWAEYCSIWIDRTSWSKLNTAIRCRLIVHEIGHLLNYSHSDSPTNIMSPDISQAQVVPQCDPGYVIQPKRRVIQKCRYTKKGVRRLVCRKITRSKHAM